MERDAVLARHLHAERNRGPSTFEKMERAQRLARINQDQLDIVNVVNDNLDKFGNFRHRISDFREETINVSKKNIMELEMASKRDRIAWMHR